MVIGYLVITNTRWLTEWLSVILKFPEGMNLYESLQQKKNNYTKWDLLFFLPKKKSFTILLQIISVRMWMWLEECSGATFFIIKKIGSCCRATYQNWSVIYWRRLPSWRPDRFYSASSAFRNATVQTCRGYFVGVGPRSWSGWEAVDIRILTRPPYVVYVTVECRGRLCLMAIMAICWRIGFRHVISR